MAEGMPGDRKTFIATCIPHDDEMQQRVAQHQKERSPSWQTVEVPIHLPEAIVEQSGQTDVLLVDCLTLWISNLMLELEDDRKILTCLPDLNRALNSAQCSVVLVSNEVGTGIVPEYPLSRRFRDLVCSTNQAVSGQADRVVWMVAGLPVEIK